MTTTNIPELLDLDPVSKEDLEKLNQLEAVRRGLADRLQELELAKIDVLSASRRIATEWSSTFQRIATSRGLDPDTSMDINYKTGQIKVKAESAQIRDDREE